MSLLKSILARVLRAVVFGLVNFVVFFVIGWFAAGGLSGGLLIGSVGALFAFVVSLMFGKSVTGKSSTWFGGISGGV